MPNKTGTRGKYNMALMKDENGQLWDVDLNGKKRTPHFGQEVGEELISNLPMAMRFTKTLCKGIDAASTTISTKIANKILDEEELQELETAREKAKTKQMAEQSKAGTGVIGDFMQIAKVGQVNSANQKAIAKHFINKIVGKKSNP